MTATPQSGAGWALAAAMMLGVAAAGAQGIRIPDLRERPAAPAPRAGEPCDGCGEIRSIREISTQRPVPVPKALQSDPVDRGLGATPVLTGAVIALPTGEGSAAGTPYVGGVGTPEMRERFSQTSYEITIRLDTGAFTVVERRDGASFRVGDRVRVHGIQLELLAP